MTSADPARSVRTERARSLFDDDGGLEPLAGGRDFEYDTCANEFSFVRAVPSGLVYLLDRPAAEELPRLYPEHYEPYRFDTLPPLVRRARDFVQQRKVRVVRRLVPGRGAILDVGCGSGALLRLLRAHGNMRWALHANEMHEPSLRQLAIDGFFPHPGPVQSIEGEARFDLIVLNQVIEHFADVHGLVAACARLLKRGGHLLIETPSTSGLDFRLFRDRHWGGYHVPRHFYLFDARTLGRLLAQHGLQTERVEYLASPAFWTQSLHHRASESRSALLRRLAPWLHLRNLPLTAAVTALDLATLAFGGRTSNLRLVARRPAPEQRRRR
jgi:2-polyprenyl-3-methyl-5-hydroxy-6-metoxy-1,4-benzoquinol methylase